MARSNFHQLRDAAGVLWLFVAILCIVLLVAVPRETDNNYYGSEPPEVFFTVMIVIYIIMGGFYTLVGVLAIVGGVFALKKKHWGWALAGSIAGTLVFFPCGVPAIIFIAMGKQEFKARQQPAATAIQG
jgi:hypothetical protein